MRQWRNYQSCEYICAMSKLHPLLHEETPDSEKKLFVFQQTTFQNILSIVNSFNLKSYKDEVLARSFRPAL